VGNITSAKSKRRDKLSIIADIIEIAREGTLKTQIMYKANLSFTQLNDYLAFMQINNLIAPSIYEGRDGYMVTERGLDFLQKHSELVNLLKTSSRSKKT
jgi:predicted transcriptional regulator